MFKLKKETVKLKQLLFKAISNYEKDVSMFKLKKETVKMKQLLSKTVSTEKKGEGLGGRAEEKPAVKLERAGKPLRRISSSGELTHRKREKKRGLISSRKRLSDNRWTVGTLTQQIGRRG